MGMTAMDHIKIVFVEEAEQRAKTAEKILTALPDWFGLPDSTREYIEQCRELPFWAAVQESGPVGFVSLKATGRQAAELHCMGVLPHLHRRGIGRALLAALEAHARASGFRLLQVKTVDEGHYPEYDRTIAFYESMGFMRLEVFPGLWDAWNPCLVLVKPLL